jgi:hypothetical protein
MTITQLTNSAVGQEMQSTVAQAVTENNSVLAGCNVHFLFRGSAVDLTTGKHGIRWLIARILTERQAVLPVYAGAYRNVYLNVGVTTEEIISKVRAVNGFDKYPDKTIADYLSVIMKRDGQVASIQLTNSEDCNRDCKRPRKKWYLLAE